MDGRELARILREEWRMETEMTQGSLVLAMTSLCDDEDALDRLAQALLEIDRQATGKRKEQAVIDAKKEKRREENEAERQERLQKRQAEISTNISRLKDREVKDIITFGKKDGKPLKWVVAEKKEDRIMVFSTECLNSEYSWGGYEKIPFNTTRKDSEWVNSSVRKWLNEDFYGKCFSAQEKERILEVKHPIPKEVVIDPVGLLFTLFKKKPDFEPGEDKIFLVSGREWISIAVYTDILKRIPEGRNFILRESEDRDGFICVKSVHIQGGKDEYYFRTENVDVPGLIYAAMWLSLT